MRGWRRTGLQNRPVMSGFIGISVRTSNPGVTFTSGVRSQDGSDDRLRQFTAPIFVEERSSVVEMRPRIGGWEGETTHKDRV